MHDDIKLVVIDDIQTIVEGISERVPWKEYGIRVVGSATDGLEGWNLVKEHQPDIVLTDIRMPKMDGLELARKLSAEQQNCKVILLSGYADFTYAQEGIRLGAFDFIKKPFSLQEILEIVLKAKEAVLETRRLTDHYSKLELKLKESLPFLRQEYFNLLLHHDTSNLDSLRRWEFLNVDLVPEKLIVMLAEIDHFEDIIVNLPVQEIELLRFALQNVLEETVHAFTKGMVFRETTKRFVIVMNAADQMAPLELAEKCCRNVDSYTRYSISIGLGTEASSLMEIKQSYHQALSALSYHFYTGGNAALDYRDIQNSERNITLPMLIETEELEFSIRSGNRQKLLGLLEKMNKTLEDLRPFPNPVEIKILYLEVAERMLKVIQNKIKPGDEQFLQMEHSLEKLHSNLQIPFHELQDMLHQIAEQGCKLVDGQRTSDSEIIIHKVVAYIRSHLHMDISVNSCAAEVFLSGSYLANLFKKATGLTLMQFVTQERISRAKELLLEDRQVQEIALELGYEDRRSFSEVFKRNTGVNPKEFKQTYLADPEGL